LRGGPAAPLIEFEFQTYPREVEAANEREAREKIGKAARCG